MMMGPGTAPPAGSGVTPGQGWSSLPPLSVEDLALLVLGAGVLIAGLWLLTRARSTPPGESCDPPLPLVGAVRRSTVYALAVCVMVLGYHVAAWTVPHVLALHVPGHRWWILIGGIALAIGGSVWAEKIEEPRVSP